MICDMRYVTIPEQLRPNSSSLLELRLASIPKGEALEITSDTITGTSEFIEWIDKHPGYAYRASGVVLVVWQARPR